MKTFGRVLVYILDGINVANDTTVLIWCKAFSKFIGAALYR